MVQYFSNQPFYKLHFSELEENAVKVLSFEGEENLSRLFEYRFDLLSEDAELDAASILNKKATFILTRGDEEPLKIHGIISHFEQRGRTPDYVSYCAVLVPKMWRLTLTYQSEIYQQMNIEKVIKKVMETSGFSGQDFEINLSQSYPELEYVVQYRETNFNFLNRRLEHFGIYYRFDHRNDNDVIVFTDANDNLPKIALDGDLRYSADKDQLDEQETVSELTCQQRVVTGLVKLKDYNYLYPEKQLEAESQIDSDSPGMYYEFGDNFEDDNQAAALARIRNQEILAGKTVFKGKSDCRLFQAGFKFKLGRHYREEWNNEYILTRVLSRGTQRGLFSILPRAGKIEPTYQNYFEAIPIDIAYRPPRRTPIPRIPGIMSARIESAAGDEYAYIDDHGRYRAKMLFDVTDRTNGEATLPIRQVQAYSGSNYGMHFPNHADAEMVWACVDGDVDRPVGLGTVPNPSNSSPSTGGNKAQSVIRTAGQNELTLDDTTGSENIYLHGTKDWTIDIVNDKNQTIGHDESASVGNNRSRNVGNDESVSVGHDRSRNVGNNETVSVGNNRDQTVGANQSVTIGSNSTLNVGANRSEKIGANHTESVGGNAKQTVAKMKTEMVGLVKTSTIGGAYQITVGAAMNETVGGAKSEQVGLSKTVFVGMSSKEQIGRTKKLTAGEKIELICGSGKITIEKNGKITIEGTELNLSASGPVTINGAVVDIN